ncbi:MAG: GNAT family N-acetyltransferase [Pseudomonadota bacterium]
MTPVLAGTPTLETERILLRGPEGADWEGWAELACSDRAAYIGGPYTRPLAFRAWGHVIGHWIIRGFGSFTCVDKATGKAFGHVGPWYPDGRPEKELGWTIWDPHYEGKGYAFEAVTRVRDHAYRELGWTTAVSYIDAPNTRSIALASRLGAVLDEGAETLDKDDPPVLVYRHPGPEDIL